MTTAAFVGVCAGCGKPDTGAELFPAPAETVDPCTCVHLCYWAPDPGRYPGMRSRTCRLPRHGRDVPHDWQRDLARMVGRGSRRRYELIGGPGGYLSIVPAGSPMRTDQYRRWVTLARVHLPREMARRREPMSLALEGQLKTWALFAYELRTDERTGYR